MHREIIDAQNATKGAKLAGEMLESAIEMGHGEEYWPTIINVVDRDSKS